MNAISISQEAVSDTVAPKTPRREVTLWLTPLRREIWSEMEEERLLVLALVWCRWYPTLKWRAY